MKKKIAYLTATALACVTIFGARPAVIRAAIR